MLPARSLCRSVSPRPRRPPRGTLPPPRRRTGLATGAAPADKKPLRYEDSASVEAKTPSVPPPADTATKLEVPVRDLPVSVSVVPGRLAAEQAALVLGDALKNASGVNVGTGFGLFDFFVVRGFDSLDTGLVLVDGAPDTEATFYPLYNVQQVEVLKGPGAFAWGGGALGSAVQVVRKQPVTPRFADLTLAYGRYGTYEAAGDANTASADGKLAFRLNAVAQGTDGYRDGRDGSIAAVNPTFAWRPDERTRVALSYEYVSNRQSPDSGLPFLNGALAAVDRRTSYQSGSDFSEQDAQRARLDAERRLNDTFVLRDKLYWAALDWQTDGTLVLGAFPFPDGRTYVPRTQGQLDDRQRLFGNQLELVATFEREARPTSSSPASRRAACATATRRPRRCSSRSTSSNPVEAEVGIYPIPLPQANQAGDSTSRVLAPYVIDRVTFSPKLQLVAGARYDSVDFEDATTATARDASKLSPLGGLVFKPVPDLSLYASGSLGFAPPSIQVVGPREPEESQQLEGGVKLSFLQGKGYASAAVYELERENIAIPDSTGLTRQSGSQRSRGVELELSRRAASRLRRPRGLRLHLGRAHGVLRDRPARAGLRGARPQRKRAGLRPAPHRLAVGHGPPRPRLLARRGPALRLGAVHGRRQPQRDRRLRRRGRRRLLRARPLPRRRPPAQPHQHRVRDPRLRLRLGDPGPPVRGDGPRRARLRPPLSRGVLADRRSSASGSSTCALTCSARVTDPSPKTRANTQQAT